MKVEIFNIIKPTSGRFHSWVNSNVGTIRKPNNQIFVSEPKVVKEISIKSMTYSFTQGVFKAVKYGILFLIAGLIAGLSPQLKEVTIGSLLVLIYNFLKIKWIPKLP